jgi:hypothetical protein
VAAEVFTAVGDPDVDELDRENAAGGEEVVILFESFKS